MIESLQVERPSACILMTNEKSTDVNMNWCSGAETHRGNIAKQYADGNYAEVWFRDASMEVSDDAISNKGCFVQND